MIQRAAALSRRAFRVLVGLATYFRSPGQWYKLRIRTLSVMLGYAYETVRSALRELRKGGFVQAKATYYDRDGANAQGANSYRLVLRKAPASDARDQERLRNRRKSGAKGKAAERSPGEREEHTPLDAAVVQAVEQWARNINEFAARQTPLERIVSLAPTVDDPWDEVRAGHEGVQRFVVDLVRRRPGRPRERAILKALQKLARHR
jgi:hypothetical protein